MNLYYLLNEKPSRNYSEQIHIYNLISEMTSDEKFDIKILSLNATQRRMISGLDIKKRIMLETYLPLYVRKLLHKGFKLPLSS
ncbi:MAG: hypothetical protein V1647_03525, partial [Pseudomonadota bacterium]